MAWYPKAVHKDIAPGSNDPAIEVVGAILHVDAGNASSLYDFFRHRSGGIESHFHIRKDGVIEQYRNTDYEADANYKANSFWSSGKRKGYVSIETQGYGAGEWTPAQIASIKALLTWLSKTHGFPLRKATAPFSGGVGFHTLFGSPSAWTPVSKSCPGPDRIKQFHSVIVPWMQDGAETPTPALRRGRPAQYFIGARGPHVTWLDKRLVAHGFTRHHDGDGYQPGPHFTEYTRKNVQAFQLAQGWTGTQKGGGADGFPGRVTLRRLAARPKPKPAPKPKPKAPTKPQIVRLQHSSLQFSDSPRQQRHDVATIFDQGADVVTWTEAGHTNAMFGLIEELGPKAGYTVYPHKWGTGVAVKKDFGKVVKHGYEFGIKGKAKSHSPRGVPWVEVQTKTGERITFGSVHYLTKGRTPKQGHRFRQNKVISQVIGKWAKRQGAGLRLVFLGGDFNIVDKHQDVFMGQPLTTCWDELKQWPNTGHGNIDAIASYDPDGRVSCKGARALNDRSLFLYSDHYTIRAEYLIQPK